MDTRTRFQRPVRSTIPLTLLPILVTLALLMQSGLAWSQDADPEWRWISGRVDFDSDSNVRLYAYNPLSVTQDVTLIIQRGGTPYTVLLQDTFTIHPNQVRLLETTCTPGLGGACPTGSLIFRIEAETPHLLPSARIRKSSNVDVFTHLHAGDFVRFSPSTMFADRFEQP